MYRLSDPVLSVKGIGGNLQDSLAAHQLFTVLDLLLFLPLRYVDRSQTTNLASLTQESLAHPDEPTAIYTILARVSKFSQHYKGRLLISRATISDDSGQMNCVWFNNRFLKNQLKVGENYFFAGSCKNQQLLQPQVEAVKEETIHTGRLVPIYSQLEDIKQGTLRRLQAEIIGKLHEQPAINQIFHQLHFPEIAEAVIAAREQLAKEELICLMQTAQAKTALQRQQLAAYTLANTKEIIWPKLPFVLSDSQQQAVREIISDLGETHPMRRLLIGDVGSGKTITAAIGAYQLIKAGRSVALIAPTKILAKQHSQSLKQLLPDLPIELVQSGQAAAHTQDSQGDKGTLYIGTHALINQLNSLRPSLVIYDEQQRFGVKQRQAEKLDYHPHRLNMTATPIPRSLMLTIFADLDVSYLENRPDQNALRKTWVVPSEKETAAWQWMIDEINKNQDRRKQAMVVCPFIDPTNSQAHENVSAVKEVFNKLKSLAGDIQIDMLHSRLSAKQQEQVIAKMYSQDTQILVTTAMVEVGVDLPNADMMLIQSAERFGLSSLHQLRGRVGRRGQDSYCLLFSQVPQATARLQSFSKEQDGLRLAQLDLSNRGAGNLFGVEQSGLHGLRFASWTNTELIKQAQQQLKLDPNYKSFLTVN